MYIADMHCDSLLTVTGETGLVNSYNVSKNNPHVQFFSAFTRRGLDDMQTRRRRTMELYNVYLYETERLGIDRITTGHDVFKVMDKGTSGALFTIEGGAGFLPDSEELRILKNGGLSVFGFAWDQNELSSSAYDDIDEGLTEAGRLMVDRLSELSVIIDVSHMSDRAFYETMELTSLPVLATHSNFRDVADDRRNLSSPMAELIAKRGGVIGLNLYPKFLSGKSEATLDDILRQVDFGLSLVGEDSIGFGFDIDGTDGCYPSGIRTYRSIHEQVIELLLSRYSSKTVEKIAGLNVLEFLKNNLP